MKITPFDTQSDLKIAPSRVRALVQTLLGGKGIKCDEVILHFVDAQTITALHRDHFNDPTLTDCISFPIDAPSSPFGDFCLLGEVFVCPAVAKAYGKVHSIDPYQELTLYIIHGLLHLIGYNDTEEEDTKVMRAEERWCLSYLQKQKVQLRP